MNSIDKKNPYEGIIEKAFFAKGKWNHIINARLIEKSQPAPNQAYCPS